MEEAKKYMQDKVDHELRCDCFIIDYAQNINIPHFGEEQPGDIYYLSPKNVYVFGISDPSKERTILHAYVYEEKTGKKGGNNVASLLMHFLTSNN